jgi:hypothetical protein
LESLAVASRPLQRHLAETNLDSLQGQMKERKVLTAEETAIRPARL